MSNVTFLGLGTMGAGMVGNLLDVGHDVRVWNRTPGKADALVARGAVAVADARDAVADAEVVMYCLADDAAVEDLVLGDDGIAAVVPADALVIDLSTIAPETSLAEHAVYAARGVRFLDAPVFGTRGEANAGGLWIVVGGHEATYRDALPVLEPLSETLHHMGGPGDGARMKLVGNLLVASQLQALGEAMSLARKAGLDLRAVLGVLAVADFRTPIYDGVGAAMLEDDYSPDFALHLMHKDARLIGGFAADLGVPVPATTATAATIERAVEAGYGDENASALVKVLASDAGVRFTD
ncbi:MAG: NAD(P)-dependent oxidoreductase [Nitriliruptoraceae bacterium]|nr:NAD(P)-dependent oxidoreductase [Nitriliruptoraceae bacterium]